MELDIKTSRRTFIKTAAILGGLGALLGISRSATGAKERPSRPQQQAQSSQGYRLTEHVKRYYETARL